MGRSAYAQTAYDIGQKIAQHTLRGEGSRISSTYLSGLMSAQKSYYSRAATEYNKLGPVATTGYMNGALSFAGATRSGTRPPLQRDKGGLQDWLSSSGQYGLLGKKGATLVLRKRVKTYSQFYPKGVGPGPAAYTAQLKARGLTPGGYEYSTVSFSKEYSYNEMKADQASQLYYSRKSHKTSGVGGVLGMIVGTTKRVFDDPSRIFTGIDPASTKLGNLVFGTDKTPIVNLMGGPSQSSYQIREEETGKKVSGSTRGFFKIADMIAGIWGGGAAAAAVGGAAGVAASGAGTMAADVAAMAASGAVKGAVSAAVQTGGEDLSAVGAGALGGAVTGAVKGAAGFYMGGAGSATSAGAGGTATSAGKDMSLWDQVSDYYTTDEGGYNWGNIAGTALKAYGAYSAYQGGKAQQDTARQAAALGQEAYQFSKAQQGQQFGLAQMTLANRMQQQQDINIERGYIRDEMRGQLGMGLAGLGRGYEGSKELLSPMMEESDATRRRQMGLLGIAGGDTSARLEQSQGYKFRMEEAMRGAERGLAGTGGTRSGRAAIELQRRSEGLAGQYFDTHIGQLGQFAQAGIGARGQLAGMRTQLGQQQSAQRLGYSQLQAGLVPRADMFNSQFGQMNPGMAGQAISGLQQLGQSQLNYGGAIGSISSLFGGGLMAGGMSGNTNYEQNPGQFTNTWDQQLDTRNWNF